LNVAELSGAIPVTAIYAGLHGLLAVALANFVENVPIALVLLLVLEMQGMPARMLHGCGGLLFLFRCLHAFGLGTIEAPNYPRLIGAQGTFVLIAVMAIACLFSALS